MNVPQSIKVLGLQDFETHHSLLYSNVLSDHLRTSHAHIDKPHKHDFYVAMIFTKGYGEHQIDFKTYPVLPGSIFLLTPGQTHHWELSDDAEGIIFFHTQAFYDTHFIGLALRSFPFFSSVQNTPAITVSGNAFIEFERLFTKVFECNRLDGIKKTPLLLSIITQIYIELQRTFAQLPENHFPAGGYYDTFERFEALLEKHFRTHKSVSQYAEMMHMTPKHLNRISGIVLQKTTSSIIADRVILEAKRMLIYAQNNISEIGRELGFEDSAHFSKIFKKKTGLTPSAFRSQFA